MSLVIAIDVGIKNLALCCYDFVTSQIVHWDNVTLVPCGRYVPAQNVQYVRSFIHKYAHLFQNAAVVVVERQMRCNMRIIEAVFQTMFFDRCHVIHPRCVKMHYGLSTRNYRTNKAMAVEWCKRFTEENTTVFPPDLLEAFKASPKQDDLADALLLCMYYLDTYSNQMTH